MTHLWVRAEQRENEERVGLTPAGAAELIKAGLRVTVEQSSVRAIGIEGYKAAGCEIAPENSWPDAPANAIIFGLKELPEDGTPLSHLHIMFGHAFKGQPTGRILLDRFKAGGGTLYDLEYLVDETDSRVAAFGYWAGYAGAAVTLRCWMAQQNGGIAGTVGVFKSSDALVDDLQNALKGLDKSTLNALIIGALGRVGTGATDLLSTLDIPVTKWDMAETASGGPFPEVLDHTLFLNCILARPGTPVFVPESAKTDERHLRVIGDIACDPDSDFSPIKVYNRTTTWDEPALRVHDAPPLDVTAIDNLPSMLPVESSEDYAEQLLPSLLTLANLDSGVWARAETTFKEHL
ncbi:saccharopine dehydrogenase (NAD+, L-lysine-forming) [Planktotalea frisia]|uniref:Saccharopine dehydrogenase [NAD(+), L-lysine-forming] n=1 Tax=Planktotalea frisia TaxID=696762 RepID=A0A1L9NZZ7_9RHOB|nr:saccharopine dehydrogenase [Planktotalea frisia]OJI94855.1 alanine dehydrogenase [Planktotalea frisia]PZX31340.1 saccharopine dehydrogenase (NAD+, L-lysine-forming) [Planktotalea frisia]